MSDMPPANPPSDCLNEHCLFQGQVMYLESSKDIKMQARTKDGKKSGSLVLGK